MDYFKIVKEAFQITWKNKYLWLFGFLIGAGSGGGNFYSGGGGDFSNLDNNTNRTTFDGSKFLADNWLWIAIVLGILVIIGLIFMILGVMAQGGIIGAVDKINRQQKSGIKDGFKIGWKYFWRVFGMGLILGLLMLFSLAILGIPVAMLFFYEMVLRAIILMIVALIIYIPLMIVVTYTSTYALRFMVLKDLKAIESIRAGFDLLMANFWKSILWSVINALIGFGIGIATFLISLIIAVPFVVLGFMAWAVLAWVGVAIVAGIGILILLIAMFLLGAITSTYKSAGWTLFFKELVK